MANDHRIRLLAIEHMLLRGRDEWFSIDQIGDNLKKEYHIDASKKAIHADVTTLTMFHDIVILGGRGAPHEYKLMRMKGGEG